jgi:hypothetical protein
MSDHENDPLLAEAIARRDESRAQILRSKANAGGAGIDAMAKAFAKLADQAAAEAKKSAEAEANIEPVKLDPEGTARSLADSQGNFAANAEVAAVGGIGIDGSNSKEGSSEPAHTADEAGTAAAPGAQKIIGDQPVGGASVAIPADWQEQHWTKQVKLAEQISGKDDLNAAEARLILEAEAVKRG